MVCQIPPLRCLMITGRRIHIYVVQLIHYQFVLKLAFKNIVGIHLLFDPRLNGHGGMNHLTMKRGYPGEYRLTPQEWLGWFLASPRYRKGHILTVTSRNLFQNLGSPLWSRASGLCQQQAERVTERLRPYYCFALIDNEQKKLQAFKVRFVLRNGTPTPLMESGDALPANVTALFCATPVLWDGATLSEGAIAAEISDWPHLYLLRTSEARGAVPEDIRRAERLTEVAHTQHLTSAAEAADALLAESRGLDREENYLHHGLGIADDGIVIVIAHGRLERIAALAAQAGATAVLITENGGSPQLGFRPAQGQFRPFLESYYFREPSIAMLMLELVPERVTFEGCSDISRMLNL